MYFMASKPLLSGMAECCILGSLVFENKPICPKCNAKDKELLTELGQSQMTDWHLGGI